MKKHLLSLIIFCSLSGILAAQDFPYHTITAEEIDMKSYVKDASAHAVVLSEYGKSRITIGNDDNIKLMYEYHVKIKIFDSKGFDNATVEIKLRNNESGNSSDQLYDVTGVTYYTDENGSTQQVELDPKKVYTTRDYKYQSTAKFTMPGLRNGCVIEYKYRIESPFFLDHFRPWEFQSDIPKMYSEYEAFIPGHFTYNASMRGTLKLSKSVADIENGCFSTHGAKSDCSHLVYGMKDIPAFIEEDYMTSPKNFLSAISFELVEYTDPYTGVKKKATKEWTDIDHELKTSDEFGVQIKKKDLFKDRLVPVLAGKTDELSKAQAVYAYIQKQFKWNDYIGIYSIDGIKKAIQSHSGSIADINISLIAAMTSAGINAEAVLLSTRDHGFVNDLYPATNDFNYVIAKVNIGDKSYFLDATDPLLSFGMLPLTCLNDKGRVMSLDKPSYWIDLNLPQREKDTYTLDFTLQDDGKAKGTLTHYSVGYKAYTKRKAIKKFNSVEEYVDDLNSKLQKAKILKSEIINLDSLDSPVEEKYEIEIKLYDKENSGALSFNPFFLNRTETNPFKLTERSYPVDWGMPSEDRFILTMHLPANYTIVTPPQTINITLPIDGGKFLTSYEPDNNSFTFSSVIQFNKSIYSPQEYPYLKELYNKIIAFEKAEMVFKKKQ
jgi:hypothetical protein